MAGLQSSVDDVRKASPDMEIPKNVNSQPSAKWEQEPTEDELREARHYWGDLFTLDKQCSETLNGLLLSLAKHISSQYSQTDHDDLTPAQLAAFYKAVGGNYDVIFVDKSPNVIAYIYQQLGCLYSLQPDAANSGFAPPSVPALKARGFIAWQTKQLLLEPAEHVPYIQKALQEFDLVEPQSNASYPKILPAECFPTEPDPATVHWYEGVSARLQAEHEEHSKNGSVNSSPAAKRTDPIIDAMDSSADDRDRAADHFKGASRSRYSKMAYPRGSMPGKLRRPVMIVSPPIERANDVQSHRTWNTRLDAPARDARRRSWHGESGPEDNVEDVEHLELARSRTVNAPKRSRDRVRSTSRGSLPSSDLDEEDARRSQARYARRRSSQSRDGGSHGSSRPVSSRQASARNIRAGSQSVRQSRAPSPAYRPRRRMSHGEAVSPQDYFPPYPTSSRRGGIPYHTKRAPSSPRLSTSPPPPVPAVRGTGFSPSTDASFAAHVAHMGGTSSDGREGASMSANYDRSPPTRPRIQIRDANGRRYSRDGEFEPRYTSDSRAARRSMEYSDREAVGRSRSNEGRYAREGRRVHDLAREQDRNIEYDDRERRQRRTRFADDEATTSTGVDGRLYAEWS